MWKLAISHISPKTRMVHDGTNIHSMKHVMQADKVATAKWETTVAVLKPHNFPRIGMMPERTKIERTTRMQVMQPGSVVTVVMKYGTIEKQRCGLEMPRYLPRNRDGECSNKEA